MKDLTDYQFATLSALDKSKLMTDLSRAASKTFNRGPIPHDAMQLLNDEQRKTLTLSRLEMTENLMKELDLFYGKHFKQPYRETDWNHPIHNATILMGHDGNRVTCYVKRLIKEEKWGQALLHINRWPQYLREIYDMFVGKTDVDVRPFFPQIEFQKCPDSGQTTQTQENQI